MEVVKTSKEMTEWSESVRADGLRIGFAPTMGCLHDGHLSLVRASRSTTDRTVASIFVNPTQFGPAEDFEKYPRVLDRDLDLLRHEGCDAVFAPGVSDIYPDGFRTCVEVTDLQDQLCGRSRPGHFRGVATIVAKLFNIVRPHRAFFGQKDAQQVIILERMTRDLGFPVEIVVCPIIREPDGLAMSSRNTYLSPAERKEATVLYRSLTDAVRLVRGGERSAAAIVKSVRRTIESTAGTRIDYVELVDPQTLRPVAEIGPASLLAVAVFVGTTRLIDNIVLGEGAAL
ncbi:MAG: pantoate--beta-alanine ligase [Acidobacteriota bacterium]